VLVKRRHFAPKTADTYRTAGLPDDVRSYKGRSLSTAPSSKCLKAFILIFSYTFWLPKLVVWNGLVFRIISFHRILSAYEINDDEVVTPCIMRAKCGTCIRIISQEKK